MSFKCFPLRFTPDYLRFNANPFDLSAPWPNFAVSKANKNEIHIVFNLMASGKARNITGNHKVLRQAWDPYRWTTNASA